MRAFKVHETSVFRPRHSASNAHTYRLLVFKERGLAAAGETCELQLISEDHDSRTFRRQPVNPRGLFDMLRPGDSPKAESARGEPKSLHRRRRRWQDGAERRTHSIATPRIRAPGSSAPSTRVERRRPIALASVASTRSLIADDLRRVHREAAQAHAEQQLGEGGVARHLAAHADVLAQRPAPARSSAPRAAARPDARGCRDARRLRRRGRSRACTGSGRWCRSRRSRSGAGTPAASAPPPAPRPSRRARPAPYARPASSSCWRARASASSVCRTSLRCATIGIRMRTLP